MERSARCGAASTGSAKSTGERLIAFYVEGQSLKEMSDEFASPIGTIKRRLHTARNRLREELTDDRPRRMQRSRPELRRRDCR